ncbi:cell division protein FtsQ [Serratia sp. D1N4]
MSQAALNTRDREVDNGPRRSNGTQLAGMIFLLMVLGTILWGGWAVIGWMKDASRLPLSKLVVTGERHYTTNDDIRQAILALGAPGTFMTQDVDIIQQQIERLPWIKQASVRKQWPDELKIHLVEYVPVAHWNDLHMVDAEGKSFSVPTERLGKQKLPLLYGPEGSEQDVLEGYRAMNSMLVANKFTLKMAAMTARHSWQLALDNDVRLELGRDDRMGRLQRFIGLYPVLQQQAQAENKRVSYVDLRYDTGASVGWTQAFIDPQAGVQAAGDRPNSNQQQNQAQAKQQ